MWKLCLVLFTYCHLQYAFKLEQLEYVGHSDVPSLGVHGGYVAKPHQFPYMAKLIITMENSTTTVIKHCGGSLVSEKYILTAAHCFKSGNLPFKQVQVILGAYNQSAKGEPDRQVFVSTEIAVNQQYRELSNHADIALIKLPSSVKQTDAVKIVKLPTFSDRVKQNYEGKTATLSGFGLLKDTVMVLPDLLRAVDLYIENCAKVLNVPQFSLICVAGTGKPNKPNKASCLGDSGGPLVLDGVQIGIVSFGFYNCEDRNSPSVFTKITSYLSWIAENSDIVIN